MLNQKEVLVSVRHQQLLHAAEFDSLEMRTHYNSSSKVFSI